MKLTKRELDAMRERLEENVIYREDLRDLLAALDTVTWERDAILLAGELLADAVDRCVYVGHDDDLGAKASIYRMSVAHCREAA